MLLLLNVSDCDRELMTANFRVSCNEICDYRDLYGPDNSKKNF